MSPPWARMTSRTGSDRLAVAALLALALALPSLAAAQGAPKTTAADIEEWMTSLSNWGRWGEDDQLGALNLITTEKRKAAAALVQSRAIQFLLRPPIEKAM